MASTPSQIISEPVKYSIIINEPIKGIYLHYFFKSAEPDLATL
jgi:hypothetical protein